MKGKLDKDVLHEQMENGVAIINNLSAYQVDQWLKTFRTILKTKWIHLWTKEKLACNRTPQKH